MNNHVPVADDTHSNPKPQIHSKIAYAKIFPPIGIARVGDSDAQDGWFIGPEWPGQQSSVDPAHRYKDGTGKVKRQAARFRIYGFDEGHRTVAELTEEEYDITWEVTLANKKPGWFRFNGAFSALSHFLDPNHQPASPDARNDEVWKLRNAQIGYDKDTKDWDFALRKQLLEIHGGTQSIKGPSAGHRADDQKAFFGSFLGRHDVYLGELRTDGDGRLLVFGARGRSGGYSENLNHLDPNNWIANYANNDRWHDDVSDGPVAATVVAKNDESREAIPVRSGAWVIAAPPDFAPDTYNIVSLYDVLIQTTNDHKLSTDELSGFLPDGNTLFWRDVFPLLHRLSGYSWVNSMALRGHGSDKPGFFDEETLLLMAEPDPAKAGEAIVALRGHVFSRIRKPWPYLLADKDGLWNPADTSHPDYLKAKAEANAQFMPPLSGDEADRTEGDPATWLTLTPIQYLHMERWAAGEFATGDRPDQSKAGCVPLLEAQPLALTRSAMERCVGGAFYPEIEITAIVREKQLFSEAFRIDSQKYEAGDITKHMACPWQSDFYACNNWWWPAQRPDEAVHESELAELTEQFPTERTSGSLASLLFKRRPWARGINTLRPKLDVLRANWIPSPQTAEDKEAYFKRVITSLYTGNPSLLAQGLERSRWGRAFVGADEATNPWRLQYERQEILDGYSGRYFQPSFPSPEEFLYSKFGQDGAKLAPALRQLRDGWPQIPKALTQYVGDSGSVLLKNYIAYAKVMFIEGLSGVLNPLCARAKDAEELAKFLHEKAPAGKISTTAVSTIEVVEVGSTRAELAYAEICQAIGDSAYLDSLNSDLGGYNGMVPRWGTLGFVVRRDIAADDGVNTTFVETETSRYDGLRYRDYFHMLMNIEKFPDFYEYAIKIVDKILAESEALIASQAAEAPDVPGIVETPFDYSPTTFNAKMEEIYEYFRADGEKMRPWFVDLTRADIIRGFLRNAVFNQCDGSWLRFIADAGPSDEIHSTLFDIWSDEVGNGDPSLHHGNLYTSLLKSLGIFLPDLESREYVDSPLLREEDFVSAVFQLSISLHAKRYFAEILGMTLYLEWEVLDLVKGVKRNDYLGFDTQFLRMHVGIDNAEDGHGAKAKRSVELHLANILNEGGKLECKLNGAESGEDSSPLLPLDTPI